VTRHLDFGSRLVKHEQIEAGQADQASDWLRSTSSDLVAAPTAFSRTKAFCTSLRAAFQPLLAGNGRSLLSQPRQNLLLSQVINSYLCSASDQLRVALLILYTLQDANEGKLATVLMDADRFLVALRPATTKTSPASSAAAAAATQGVQAAYTTRMVPLFDRKSLVETLSKHGVVFGARYCNNTLS
jgi:hypothetical protein